MINRHQNDAGGVLIISSRCFDDADVDGCSLNHEEEGKQDDGSSL